MSEETRKPKPAEESTASSPPQQSSPAQPSVAIHESGGLSWDLLFDFHAMIAELERTDGIVDVQAQMHPPVPLFTLETIEHGLGIRVPDRIRSLYMVCDGFEFSWSYQREADVIPGGGAHLFDFATVFDSWLDSLWLSDEGLSEEQCDFMWTLRGFDRTYHGASEGHFEAFKARPMRQMVVMCVEEEYPTYDLFVHDLDTRDSRLLDVSFREYFDCLLATRGTYGWQTLLLEGADAHHLRKPDADIFRLALDIAQVPASQILYIENTPLFVEIAQGLGIQSVLHDDYRSTRDKLAAFGLIIDEG